MREGADSVFRGVKPRLYLTVLEMERVKRKKEAAAAASTAANV